MYVSYTFAYPNNGEDNEKTMRHVKNVNNISANCITTTKYFVIYGKPQLD